MIEECANFFPDSNYSENVILSKGFLRSLVTSSYCEECSTAGNVSFKNVDSDGTLEVKCPNCNAMLFSEVNKTVSKKKFAPDTAAMVLHCLNTGSGYAGYQSMTTNLNLPAVNSRRFEEYKHFVGEEVRKKNEKNMEGVRKCIEKAYAELEIFPDDQGILDIEVSFDGTWMKRGHRSHYGAAAVIEVYTGFIVDFEILSSFCHWCSKSKTRTPEEKKQHKEACNINFYGKSSGAMEKEQAIRLWQRSEATRSRESIKKIIKITDCLKNQIFKKKTT